MSTMNGTNVTAPLSPVFSPDSPDSPGEEPASGLRLGRGVVLEGKLSFQGSVRIDAAEFKGSIVTTDALVVGDGARIGAEIDCGSMVVHGQVTGSIRARESVELRASARVRCDMETPSLVIEKGAIYQGALKMTP
jgi:cytoskeletal protein CcmA (bactofilin family)